eukprot:CAMPEP_0114995718 /NCGR_PEP_ID=MMETSP0216-20121206/13893_1 /TAXON_ID=223996 /ORGANISM="Protocruzia adherens, Strain Boccale" /LENGTH=380 /DNA_ID=CAMNT_0002359807 /DNA_START=49 /DNA_END=1191 /DNA_ORIENTATION=-
MTSYEKPTERPEIGVFSGFDHCVFWVGNAKQAASFYTARFGFDYVAYQGLETGERSVCSHVVKQNDIYFVFKTPLGDNAEMSAHQAAHGDGVRDVAFTVDDARGIYDKAVARGAKSVSAPEELTDEFGTVVIASVQTYGDTIHTFVQRDGYKGPFLPGYKAHKKTEIFNNFMRNPHLLKIDHCVGNQPDQDMEPTAAWYEKMLDFHRFWSVDDSQMHTEYSALRSIVMTDFDEVIKMPINEPAPGKRKSQIQEYVEFYSGAGVQHIALLTENIIEAIEALRARGVDFLEVPESYYDNLEKRLANSPVKIAEDMAVLRKLKILVDYDDKGYLLQLFTKPVEDRPTLFIEIIQRRNHQGFGAGNFKALFEAIELEQSKRGNL